VDHHRLAAGKKKTSTNPAISDTTSSVVKSQKTEKKSTFTNPTVEPQTASEKKTSTNPPISDKTSSVVIKLVRGEITQLDIWCPKSKANFHESYRQSPANFCSEQSKRNYYGQFRRYPVNE
jgi:hypothetical protein